MQQSSCCSLPQSVKAGLSVAMFYVRGEHERGVEKDLFDFRLADLVFVGTFTPIVCIPIEPFDFLEVDHGCIFS